MFLRVRSFLAFAAMVAVPGAALPQPTVTQSLRDVWVATSGQLLEVDYDVAPTGIVVKNPSDVSRNFQALAFEEPLLGSATEAVRGLIAVDGTKIWRFDNGSNELPPTMLFDAASAPSQLRFVTAVAVTEDGTILFSGYSRPKRVFEIWELTPGQAPRVEARASSTPQLVDAVYVRAEDVAAGSLLAGGGLLATAGKQVLFFSKSSGFMATSMLLDGKALGLKGAAEFTSADLVRDTTTLMVATTERKLLTVADTGGPVTTFATVPGSPSCLAARQQRLVVRNAQGGDEATSVVADSCGQVARYDFSSATSQNNQPVDVATYSSPLVAVAVGEGNEISCEPNVTCPLISNGAFDAIIQSQAESRLLVLRYENLCDRRVAPQTCTIGDVEDGKLVLNSLLPPNVQAALGEVKITIPAYMFAAGYAGRFGVVFVQADEVASSASATIELDIQKLFDEEFELGVRVDFPRPTDILSLLNQDVAAYAPDNPSLPTVRGFEATPATLGVRNPMVGALRGFSAVIYGLQHDLYPPGPRAVTGGLPPGTVVNYGSTPLCNLSQGNQQYVAVNDPSRYFMNLVACLLADEETLLTSVIPVSAFEWPADRTALLSSLGQVKDKLIKALSGGGPNTGAEAYQAVLSQLDQFDAAIAATPFVTSLVIYKNELAVRSKVFRFNLLSRAYPSLPSGGF